MDQKISLNELCTNGDMFRSKYELMRAIDKVLLNLVCSIKFSSLSPDDLPQDYINMYRIKQAISKSKEVPDSHEVLEKLVNEDHFTGKEGLLRFISNLKDKVILWYGGLNSEDCTDVRDDYLFLCYLSNALKTDLKHAYPFASSEIIERGRNAIKVLVTKSWYEHAESDNISTFDEFKRMLNIYENNLKNC